MALCTVSGTILDPNGVAFAGASLAITFVPATGATELPLFSGGPFQQVYATSLDSSGAFSIPLPGNDVITPTGSTWKFSVISSDGTATASASVSCTSTSKSVSANLNATATTIGAALAATKLQGAGKAGTDQAGSDVTLSPGLGTGAGATSKVIVNGPAASATSAATTQASIIREVISYTKTGLTTGAATALIDIALPTLGMGGLQINYLIESTDATDMQTTSGSINLAVVNKGAAYTSQASSIGNLATACSSGALSAVWAFTNGTNKITAKVTPTATVITPTFIRITYEVINFGQTQITIL